MNPRIRSLSMALVAIAIGVGGWLATLWAASEQWVAFAFCTIGVLLIAAAFRGKFAASERARDFWTGFALFGLIHFVAADSYWQLFELMTCSVVDFIGDRLLGVFDTSVGHYKDLPPLGRWISEIPVVHGDGSPMDYLSYVRETTKLFASLAFAAIGGLLAWHLRRSSIRGAANPRLRGCPLLGIAWLYLLGVLIGATFAICAHPVVDFDNPVSASAEAIFALYNVEFLAVLFAALEARFADDDQRAWWVGFALFGGAYRLAIYSPLATILPTKWMGNLFQWIFFRFVCDSQLLTDSVQGLPRMNNETLTFFQPGLSWAGLAAFSVRGVLPMANEEMEEFYVYGLTWVGLATFLPVAWLGTLAARLARRLGASTDRPRLLERWRVRSSIGRNMLALLAMGLFLAALKNPSEVWVTAFGHAIVGLFLFAALRASYGPESSRAWWWGFALVGGIDLLIGAIQDNWSQWSSSTWLIHRWVSLLYRLGFERYHGAPVPELPTLGSLDAPQVALYLTYYRSRPLVLMAISLPMAWIGATSASWIDRRR
jgi:hypothetical protein